MRARRTIIKSKTIKTSYKIYEYTCPKCKVCFKLHNAFNTRVTRFLCDCGQEIIVDLEEAKNEKP